MSPKSRIRLLESYNRRSPSRLAKRLFYIFCEGETEEKYFHYLKGREGLDLDNAMTSSKSI